ncbi:titin homolog [Gouania willdenowi]|uniref:titin homolog n=1 Tax=Gouania willdenowi TaxID=441366 RepID=UPI001055C7E5|nr:titin homolog [Gouania willdenowi]
MMGKNLVMNRIACVEMKSVLSPEFASQNRRVLQITNLPKYEDSRYTERDVANLLTPFGFQQEEGYLHNIYIIPQKRMAFAVLPTAKMAINIIRASVKDCFKLSGCNLIMKILEDNFSTPMEFYRFLMMWMNEIITLDQAERIVFMTNVSPNDARNLRDFLRKIGSVKNYAPLLNKVFIEFHSILDADRLGVWYSLLHHPPQHILYRLGTPRSTNTAPMPKNRDIPDLRLRVPTIFSIPLGCCSPFYVTMTTFPFIFATASPWFKIPLYVNPFAARVHSRCSTIMMTGLPEEGYCQMDVARIVWNCFRRHNMHTLFYKVMVLPLQRRAFIYFDNNTSCWVFCQQLITKPVCIRNKPVDIDFVINNRKPAMTEETMYRQLMKLSNAYVPALSGLDQRLLLVQVSEVSLELIQAVMKEVVSVGRLAGFLPLGNRICIEMLDPIDQMKVMEAKLGSLTAPHIWKKVIRVDTVQSLRQTQVRPFIPTNHLKGHLYHWAASDQTAQDSTMSSSSLTKPAPANTALDSVSTPKTSKDVEMVEEGLSGAVDADFDVANSDDLTRTKKVPEGHTPSKNCHVVPTPSMERPEGQKLFKECPEGPTSSGVHPEDVKPSLEHTEGLSADLKPSKEHSEGWTSSEKCLEVTTPFEEHLEGLKPTEEDPEGLTPSKKCSEGPTQSKKYLECMIPSEKCPEGPGRSKEQSKGQTPSDGLPQGPTLSEELSQGLTPSEELIMTDNEEGLPMGEDQIKTILAAIQQHKRAKQGKVPMGFTADVRFSDRGDMPFDQDTDKFVTPDEVSDDTKDTAKDTQGSNSSKEQLRRQKHSKTSEQKSKSDRASERSRSPSLSQRRQRDSCTTTARGKSRSTERRSHCVRDKSRSPEHRSHRGRNNSRSDEDRPYHDRDNSPTAECRSHCSEDQSPSNECKEKSSSTKSNSELGEEELSGTESKERSPNTESRSEQEKSPDSSLAALSAVGLMLSAENTVAEPRKETHLEAPKEDESSVTQSEELQEEMENHLNLFEENIEEEESQLPEPEEDQSLDGHSFQVLDIKDEGRAKQEESVEPQTETSFQVLESVTEDQSATDHATEVAVTENASDESKVSNVAKRSTQGRGGKRGRKSKVLAANKDRKDQENVEINDSAEPKSQASKDVTTEAELEPIKEGEVYQVIDLVDKQSAPNAKKKQGRRGRPTRRSARGRNSEGESEEKQDETQTESEVPNLDSIINKKRANEVARTVLDTAGSETIQETEKVGRRRSTRGNKEEKITSSSIEEPKYQVSDSVEDDGTPEEEVTVTRSTRGRRGQPAKRDISTRGHTAPKKSEEVKETSPKVEETAVTAEEAAYKVIDSVEDEGVPDAPPVSGQKRKRGRPRNIKATTKPAASKKAKVEIEEEPTYPIIDSVEEEAAAAEDQEISTQPGTDEKSSTPEDDYNKQKITKSVCEEDKEKPTYQIVDSVEDAQGQEETEDDSVPDNIPDTKYIKGSTKGAEEQKDYTNLSEDENHESSTWGSAHVILHKEAKELEINNEELGCQSSFIEECRSKEMEITAFEAQELLTVDEVGADEAPEEGEQKSSEKKEEVNQEEPRSQSSSREARKRKEMNITIIDIQELLTLDKIGADNASDKREADSSEQKKELKSEVDVQSRSSSREGPRRKEVEMDQVDTQELLTLFEVGADDALEPPEAEGPEIKEELPIYEKENDHPISESGQSLDRLKSETLAAVDKEKDDDHLTDDDITEESDFIMLDEARKEEVDPGPNATTSGRKVVKDGDEETQTKESQSDELAASPSMQQISTSEAESSGQSDKGATVSLEERRCEVKVVDKRRKELVGPESKQSRSQSPDVPADFTLPKYIPGNPLGQEFVVPKAGFFCNICSIIYANENTAKEVHCSSRRHYNNLKKYYLKLRTTPSEC